MERIRSEQCASAIVSALNFKLYHWYERQNTDLPMDEYVRTAPSNWIFNKLPVAKLGRFIETTDLHKWQTTFIGVFVWFQPQYKLKMMALSKDDICAQLAPGREDYRYRPRRLASRLVLVEAIDRTDEERVVTWTVNVGFEDKQQARAYQKQLWDEKRCAHAKFRERAYSHTRTGCPYELKIWFLDLIELERLSAILASEKAKHLDLSGGVLPIVDRSNACAPKAPSAPSASSASPAPKPPLWVQRPDPEGDYQFLRRGKVEARVPDKTRALARIREYLERGDAVMLRDITKQVEYRAQLAAGRVVLHPEAVG